MKKLSELKDEDMLMVGDDVISKEDLLEDWEYYKDKEVFTTIKYYAGIDAFDMLESTFEYESDEMYEEWFDKIMEDITEKDIEEIQSILDRILARNKQRNFCYVEDEKIEIDI